MHVEVYDIGQSPEESNFFASFSEAIHQQINLDELSVNASNFIPEMHHFIQCPGKRVCRKNRLR